MTYAELVSRIDELIDDDLKVEIIELITPEHVDLVASLDGIAVNAEDQADIKRLVSLDASLDALEDALDLVATSAQALAYFTSSNIRLNVWSQQRAGIDDAANYLALVDLEAIAKN